MPRRTSLVPSAKTRDPTSRKRLRGMIPLGRTLTSANGIRSRHLPAVRDSRLAQRHRGALRFAPVTWSYIRACKDAQL